jgi:hypothetical protein
MSRPIQVNNSGNFLSMLTIVFIILKLTNYIDWPWVWVLSPIWITLSVGAIILLIVFLLVILIKEDSDHN